MRSAFERLLRMDQTTPAEHGGAIARLERLRTSWRELAPTEGLRREAETLLSRFPLKGADALQLAAAVTWSGSQPKGRVLISADVQLLDAARQLGFQAVSA
jgi:predicted nucleic acid-binding protein